MLALQGGAQLPTPVSEQSGSPCSPRVGRGLEEDPSWPRLVPDSIPACSLLRPGYDDPRGFSPTGHMVKACPSQQQSHIV